jgi:hypothetical protein
MNNLTSALLKKTSPLPSESGAWGSGWAASAPSVDRQYRSLYGRPGHAAEAASLPHPHKRGRRRMSFKMRPCNENGIGAKCVWVS